MDKDSGFPGISFSPLLLAALVLAWFLFFAYWGIFADFSGDDLVLIAFE